MKQIRFRLILLIVAITLQIAWYAVLMVSFIRTPGKLEGADFLTYYSVGRVASQHGLSRVYDLDLEAAAQAETAGVAVGVQYVLPPNHPPFLYPFLEFLARLSYREAYIGYTALLGTLVIVGLIFLGSALEHNGWPRGQVYVTLVGVLLFEPLFMSILKGQDSALLLLGGFLWLSGLSRNDDRLAGLGLSMTLIRPQIALLLGLPYLCRQRKVFFWFLVGAIGLVLYSFLQVGWSGMADYIQILTLSAGGEGYGMAESAMFNFTGLLLRLAPRFEIGLVHAIGWGFFVAALATLCVLWGRSKTIGFRHIALSVTLSLFASPHLHYHDLSLLAVPLVGLGIAGVAAGRLTVSRAAALPMTVSVLLLFCEIWDPARFTVPYLLMAALIISTWLKEKRLSKLPKLAT